MSYTLEELAADIHHALAGDPGPAGRAAVCMLVSRALTDRDFVATHLKDRPAGSNPRAARCRLGRRVRAASTPAPTPFAELRRKLASACITTS
jgi:hypothetical protein